MYKDACSASFLPSVFLARYSEAAIESEAAIPVIPPVSAISCVFWRANVKPARAPVSSTRASFRPRTIEPMYSSFFSLRISMRACSCSSSSFAIWAASGMCLAMRL